MPPARRYAARDTLFFLHVINESHLRCYVTETLGSPRNISPLGSSVTDLLVSSIRDILSCLFSSALQRVVSEELLAAQVG